MRSEVGVRIKLTKLIGLIGTGLVLVSLIGLIDHISLIGFCLKGLIDIGIILVSLQF